MTEQHISTQLNLNICTMSVVNGKDVILSISQGGAFNPIACNAVCSLLFERDEIETTFRDSGDVRTFVPGKANIMLEGSGPIEYASDYSPADVVDAFIAKTIINWEFTLSDANGHAPINKTYSGSGFFRSVSLTGDVQQAATCDYTIRVTGAISGTTDPALVPPTLKSLFYDATGGETTIFNVDWVGADMLEVMRNGIGLEIIDSGTPGGSQVLFDSVAGTLTFNSGLALSAGEYIQTLYES